MHGGLARHNLHGPEYVVLRALLERRRDMSLGARGLAGSIRVLVRRVHCAPSMGVRRSSCPKALPQYLTSLCRRVWHQLLRRVSPPSLLSGEKRPYSLSFSTLPGGESSQRTRSVPHAGPSSPHRRRSTAHSSPPRSCTASPTSR